MEQNKEVDRMIADDLVENTTCPHCGEYGILSAIEDYSNYHNEVLMSCLKCGGLSIARYKYEKKITTCQLPRLKRRGLSRR